MGEYSWDYDDDRGEAECNSIRAEALECGLDVAVFGFTPMPWPLVATLAARHPAGLAAMAEALVSSKSGVEAIRTATVNELDRRAKARAEEEAAVADVLDGMLAREGGAE